VTAALQVAKTSAVFETCSQTAHNVLDKVAVFLKWDLNLPETERAADFKRVWHRGRDTALRPEVSAKDDPNLYALYDISLDLGHPSFERLSQIRHAITHRQLVVHDWLLHDWLLRVGGGRVQRSTFSSRSWSSVG